MSEDYVREALVKRGYDPYLTMNEAVVYTGFCDRTLRQYIADGKLRAYRAGRAFRFKKTDLDALFTATDRWGA